MAKRYGGHCACGAVTYEFDNEPTFVANCHCTDCKRASGVATLVALDLEHVGSAVTANDYFYSFLGIVLSCVALVALTGVLVASAWTFFSSDTATRSRATLRALTTRSTRDSMSLRAMPTLASRPSTDHAVRALASETWSSAVIGMTLIFVAVTLMLFPAVIGLYT